MLKDYDVIEHKILRFLHIVKFSNFFDVFVHTAVAKLILPSTLNEK